MSNYTSIVQNESQTDYKSNKDDNLQPESIVIVNCVLNAPLMLTSITGNALALAAILRTPSLRSPSNVFLCSLALSDLLVGLIVQPVFIATVFNFVPDSSLVLTYQMTTLFVCGVSLGTMTAISVDSSLSHAISEFNDYETCSIYIGRYLALQHRFIVRYIFYHRSVSPYYSCWYRY